MKGIKIMVCMVLVFTLGSPLFAQSEDLREDSSFFERQQVVFQDWLEETGLSPALQAEELRIDSQQLQLWLRFDYSDRDTAVAAWDRLRSDFQVREGLALEERLFFKLAFLMEVGWEHLEIKLYNQPAYGQLPILDGTIYFDSAVKKVARRGIFRTEVQLKVVVPSFKLDTTLSQQAVLENPMAPTHEVRKNLDSALVETLMTYFGKITEKHFLQLQTTTPIVLQIRDIQSQVFTNGTPGIRQPHEYLQFTIDYRLLPEGLHVYLTVDGKYGSIPFEQSRRIYTFEPSEEYREALNRYTRLFLYDPLMVWIRELLHIK